jgi:hypothetical protein
MTPSGPWVGWLNTVCQLGPAFTFGVLCALYLTFTKRDDR